MNRLSSVSKKSGAEHHERDIPERESAAVRLYLDDSGSKDPNTPHAVMGGLVINRSFSFHFEEAWDRMLDAHGITPPIHMKEFAPNRRFGRISPRCRRELFLEIVDLIMSHRIASIEAGITNAEYEATVMLEARKIFSAYAMCFGLAVEMNHQLAEGRYDGKIPFILDIGNPHSHHITQAHAAILAMQKEGRFCHAGRLYFEDDAEFGVLQAADVIAWGARRRTSNKPFPLGLEPIGEMLAAHGHNEASWKDEWLVELNSGLIKEVQRLEKLREER